MPQRENPLSVKDQYGFCDHDVRHNFNIAGVYAIPTAPRIPHVIGSGWEISSVFNALSGRPFTAVISSSFDPSGQGLAGSGTVDRASWDGSPVQYDSRNSAHGNPFHYVKETYTAAGQADPCGNTAGGLPLSPFFVPCVGTVGNSPRNLLRGPGLVQLDATLLKNTHITERLTMQFRWEVYNILNHANFDSFILNNNITSTSAFGTIARTPDVAAGNPVIAQGGPRSMNFALKFTF